MSAALLDGNVLVALADEAHVHHAGARTHARHVFWSDSVSYGEVSLRGVQGHRQVTDAYLAALARHHAGRLVTLDGGLAAPHADVAELIPR